MTDEKKPNETPDASTSHAAEAALSRPESEPSPAASVADQNRTAETTTADSPAKRQIKIGSQRELPKTDEPTSSPASADAALESASPASSDPGSTASVSNATSESPVGDTPADADDASADHARSGQIDAASETAQGGQPVATARPTPDESAPQAAAPPGVTPRDAVPSTSGRGESGAGRVAEADAHELFPAPAVKRISAELQAEIDEVLGEFSLDELMAAETKTGSTAAASIELDQRYMAQVVKWDRESVFFTIGGQHEAIAARRQFEELPAPGSQMEVVPVRFSLEDNLYEVVVPGASVDVQDWSDLSEGVVVSARITGHNKGGLECEVNHIRGFIPVSQISMYRVDDLEPYVNQSLQCVVTECNPDRRNLVLSHRSVLEREREEARQKLLEELEVGQVREGTVQRLQNFGAFVDLGGIDGLIHVSQLSWDRVNHPSEVLEEGQRVKVRIEKIDPQTGKIGLSYRDLLEDPWEDADTRFAVGTVVSGTVAKIMEFGAFVKLTPGVEGLVHISEIAHHRVHKVGAFLKEGQDVQVKVLSMDRDAQRISLSIKAAQASPAAEKLEQEDKEPDLTQQVVPQRQGPLKGGLNRGSGGDQFGLKW